MIYEKQEGVPKFSCTEYGEKTKDYVVLIPIINEGDRIRRELQRAKEDLSDIDSNIRYYKNERDAWKRIKTNNYYNMEYYKRKIP